jgi:hypothetical protein
MNPLRSLRSLRLIPPVRSRPTYQLAPDGKSITCLTCHRTSYNPNDVKEKYCGACHKFHEDP